MNEVNETDVHPAAIAARIISHSGALRTIDTSSSVIPTTCASDAVSNTRRWLTRSASRPSTGLATPCEISIAAATVPASASDPVTAEIIIRQAMDRMAIGNRPIIPQNANAAAPGFRSSRT